jgi:hypothetical protein
MNEPCLGLLGTESGQLDLHDEDVNVRRAMWALTVHQQPSGFSVCFGGGQCQE